MNYLHDIFIEMARSCRGLGKDLQSLAKGSVIGIIMMHIL